MVQKRSGPAGRVQHAEPFEACSRASCRFRPLDGVRAPGVVERFADYQRRQPVRGVVFAEYLPVGCRHEVHVKRLHYVVLPAPPVVLLDRQPQAVGPFDPGP